MCSRHKGRKGSGGQVGEPLSEIACRSHPAKGVVWADGVADVLPAKERLDQAGQAKAALVVGVELFLEGALSPLDMPVEFGGAGREHKHVDLPLSAGLLEAGLEFAASVHLDSFHRKRHALDQSFQELLGRGRRGSAVGFPHVATRDHIPRGVPLDDYSGERMHFHRV